MYITVLDFEEGGVYQYYIAGCEYSHEEYEAFISGKGHNLKNVEWMWHEDNNIRDEND